MALARTLIVALMALQPYLYDLVVAGGRPSTDVVSDRIRAGSE